MNWLAVMLPSFIVAALICAAELLVRPEKSDWWRNLQAWALQVFAAFTLLPLFQAFNLPSLIDGNAMAPWLGAVFYLVLRDALEYFYHRAQHSIPLLWSVHALHHSDPNMSALTTNRHFWGDQLIKAVTIWPLAALVIAPTPLMIGVFTFASFWHFVVHARLRISFGKLSWLLNSPAYHRRHHSILPEHYNSNYSALFPIFDVLCGSYNRPDGWPPTGLDHAPESFIDVLAWPVRQSREEGVPAPAAN